MSKFLTLNFNGRRQLVWIIGLMALFGLMLPAQALAAPPHDEPVGAELCADCHEQETDAWQNSPHARASANEQMPGATCENCHGPYVDDHPDKDVMQLKVDSSICDQCHTTTYNQWKNSSHAQAGVQCIGCHLSHSQEFRLTDEAQCGACHRDRQKDFAHSVHGAAGVACTDCHFSSTVSQQMTGTGEPGLTILAPSHDFTAVLAADCVDCHGPDLHQMSPTIERVADVELASVAERVPALTAKLETTRQENKSLQTMVPVSLGLGMGIGGILGIVFTLAVGYIYQRRRQS